MSAVLVRRTRCRVCTAVLQPILSLGDLYLSDFPGAAGARAHPAVPLDLLRCTDPTCGLVQLGYTTPPAWLYGETYWYYSGVNDTMRAELLDVVRGAAARTTLPKHAVVVDIGANDGTLLQQYTAVVGDDHFLLKVAYEPARSHYAALRPHAHVVYPEYFTVDDPWPLPTTARIITAIAMFYDLEDPHAFVASLTKALHPDGVVVIQQAYLFSMLATTDISNIGHEHLEYYHLAPLEKLLAAHGLEVVDVELRAINGGSFRVYVQFMGRGVVSPRVAERRAEEARLLAIQPLLWEHFTQRVQTRIQQIHAILASYRDQGAVIDLLGASTKGNTLLQVLGIDSRVIRQAWERSPTKIGRYVGVSGIPIVTEAYGRADPPDVLFVGIWQFRDALLIRESAFLSAGGQLLFPLPHVEVVRDGERRTDDV